MTKTMLNRKSDHSWRKQKKPPCVFVVACAVFLTFAVTVWPVAEARAHGATPIDEDSCARFMGRNIIHFSAYQPQFDRAGHYCEEIPKAGETIVVVDLYNQRLRQVPVALKIIDPMAAETDQILIAMKPKVYTHGVIEAETNFTHSGVYEAIVTIMDGDQAERSIRFKVEPSKVMTYVSRGVIYAVMLILIGLLIGRPIWNMVQNRRGAG